MRKLDLTVSEDRSLYFEIIQDEFEIDFEVFVVEYIEKEASQLLFIYPIEQFETMMNFLEIVQCRANVYVDR